MLDSHKIYNALKASFSNEQADVLTTVISETFLQFDKLVTKEEFSELKAIVKELAEAQARTEQRLDELTVRVNQLAEAQKRTEQRLNELAEAQARTEQRLDELTVRVNQLAEAQKRTEQRLNELAEAQKKVEEQISSLFEAIRRLTEQTDKMQRKFSEDIADIRKNLGGLSMAVGYGIEDRAMPYFYDLAKKDYGVTLKSVDRRNYVYPDGKYDEINIFAEGVKSGKRHLIVAECKAQPSKKDADRFAEMIARLEQDAKATIHPILIGYVFSPEVEVYAKEHYPSLRLMKTYEFEMNYKRINIISSPRKRSKKK